MTTTTSSNDRNDEDSVESSKTSPRRHENHDDDGNDEGDARSEDNVHVMKKDTRCLVNDKTTTTQTQTRKRYEPEGEDEERQARNTDTKGSMLAMLDLRTSRRQCQSTRHHDVETSASRRQRQDNVSQRRNEVNVK
jgi:hypothetical protein